MCSGVSDVSIDFDRPVRSGRPVVQHGEQAVYRSDRRCGVDRSRSSVDSRGDASGAGARGTQPTAGPYPNFQIVGQSRGRGPAGTIAGTYIHARLDPIGSRRWQEIFSRGLRCGHGILRSRRRSARNFLTRRSPPPNFNKRGYSL